MKVLFVFVNVQEHLPCWSPAIQALSSVLKLHGHSTALIHVARGFVPDKIRCVLAEVKKHMPVGLIGFSCTSFEFSRVKVLAAAIKHAFPDVPLVLGGTHATLWPEDLTRTAFDGFCVGEGEEALLELVEKIEKGEDWLYVKNFCFKLKRVDDGSVGLVRNPVRPFVKNLDSLPMWDWIIMDTRKLLEMRKGWLGAVFSRGCPGSCSFCVNDVLRKIKGKEGYTRRRSVENAIVELKYVIGKYPVRVVNIEDDLLVQDRRWITEFAVRFRKEIFLSSGIRFKIESRVDVFDESLARVLAEGGCQEVQFGVETANVDLLKILDKRITRKQVAEAFSLCDKYKMKTMSFLMLGVPGETEATIGETLDLMVQVKPGLIISNFYQAVRGTRLYDYCVSHGLLRRHVVEEGDFRRDSMLRLKGISRKRLVWFGRLMPWHLNVRMGLAGYAEALDMFQDVRGASVRKQLEQILLTDKRLDAETLELHFRFFGFKPNYTEKVGERVEA